MTSPASAIDCTSMSSGARPAVAGASRSTSSGGAASPRAATAFTASPVCSAICPPGSAGASRIGPAMARTTGIPVMSRTKSR